jgi:hypothetical protein
LLTEYLNNYTIMKYCREHVPICHLFELILVIHANTSNETNHIVYHVLVDISRSHGCNQNQRSKETSQRRKKNKELTPSDEPTVPSVQASV